MCVVIFSATYIRNSSHSIKNSAKILPQMYWSCHIKCLIFLSKF